MLSAIVAGDSYWRQAIGDMLSATVISDDMLLATAAGDSYWRPPIRGHTDGQTDTNTLPIANFFSKSANKIIHSRTN